MSTFILINTVILTLDGSAAKLWPGTSLDDSSVDTAKVIAAGGELRAASNTAIVAAAARVKSARGRGANEADCEAIMRAVEDTQQDTTSFSKLFHYENPATASTTGVTAAFSGTGAANDPANDGTAITQPDMPRNVTATFGATWDAANDAKVYGTNQFDEPVSEVLAANPGGTTTGNIAFKTVTKVTKKAQTDDGAGNAANICSIGTGVKLGVPAKIADTFGDGHLLGTGFDVPTLDTTFNTVSFATAPNGARDWNMNINILRDH